MNLVLNHLGSYYLGIVSYRWLCSDSIGIMIGTMFEESKDKILQYNYEDHKKPESSLLSPEALKKLEQQGIDPENVIIDQLFPETLDEDGNDLSLMSGAEWEIMVKYAKTRKYLLENYPQSREETKTLGHTGVEQDHVLQ